MQAAIFSISLALLYFPGKGASEESGCRPRNIYLNGVDITGSINQDLKKVSLHINEKGDIFITAPHYQAFEEDHYLPLNQYLDGKGTPRHKKPALLSKGEGHSALKTKGPPEELLPEPGSQPFQEAGPAESPIQPLPEGLPDNEATSLQKQGDKVPQP